MPQPGNEEIGRIFDRVAKRYDRQMALSDWFLWPNSRDWAVSQAHGRVLEVAVGTGLNLPLYPSDATVLGIDLSEMMIDQARRRASQQGLADRVTLRTGDAQALDVPDESMDTVVSTYSFCTIPDPRLAAREAFRVLRGGGTFLLVEHGPSTRRWVRASQRVVDPCTIRFMADHLMRDPRPYLTEAGFVIEEPEHGGRFGLVFRVRASKA